MLAGYRALALRDVGRMDEARKVVESLSHRSDAHSAAWAMGLAAAFADPPLKPADAVIRLRQAIDRMVQNAQTMGANAIIMMRFDSSEIGQVMSEIVAYGTAAVVEKA